MGGSSADIGIVAGGRLVEATARDTWIAGFPLLTPMIDIHTIGAGGGYGDPRLRDPAAVRDDVLGGLITAAQARQVHGVVLAPDPEAVAALAAVERLDAVDFASAAVVVEAAPERLELKRAILAGLDRLAQADAWKGVVLGAVGRVLALGWRR
jgi:hypothetical protein